MAYKDKDKQNAAAKERMRRYRAQLKGVTYKPKGVTNVTPEEKPVTPDVTPCNTIRSRVTERLYQRNRQSKPKPQSYNPMMVGYVPPKPEGIQ